MTACKRSLIGLSVIFKRGVRDMRKFGIYIIMIVIGLCSGSALAGQEQVDQFVMANAAYTRGDYSQALALYDEILAGGAVSGALLYNIGNTYFKIGDLGRAVLYYERALRYIPRDADLRANYRYALSQRSQGLHRESGSLWGRVSDAFIQMVTFAELCWIFAGLLFLLAFFHLWGLYGRWRGFLRAGSIGILIVLIFGVILGIHLHLRHDLLGAVILRDVPARFEPREDATVHFSVFEGEQVELIKKEKKWMKIKRFDDKIGWVQSDMVEKI